MSTDLNLLKPFVKEAWLKAKADLDGQFVRCVLTSACRTTDEQVALFAQGRESLESVNEKRSKAFLKPLAAEDNSYVITKCDGINNKSNHQSGLAIDVVPLDSRNNPYWPPNSSFSWVTIAVTMKKYGFNWGGDWKQFPDYPHYEMSDRGTV